MKLRDMEPDDTAFVFNSWLKSFRGSRSAGVVPNNLYYSVYRSTIENLIGRGAVVEVACDDEKPSRIYGWICREVTPDGFPVVHYLYVKDPYIKFSVDDLLLTNVSTPPFYTFAYRQVEDAIQKKFGRAKGWVPEIARRK